MRIFRYVAVPMGMQKKLDVFSINRTNYANWHAGKSLIAQRTIAEVFNGSRAGKPPIKCPGPQFQFHETPPVVRHLSPGPHPQSESESPPISLFP